MNTDVYISLNYEQYKDFEQQLADFKKLETTHTTMGSPAFYHRAFRLRVGSITFEIQGPRVMEPPIADVPNNFADVREGKNSGWNDPAAKAPAEGFTGGSTIQ